MLKELAPLSRVFPALKDLAAFWGTLSLRGDIDADSPRQGIPRDLEHSLGLAEVLLAGQLCRLCVSDTVLWALSAQKPVEKLQNEFCHLVAAVQPRTAWRGRCRGCLSQAG